MTYQDFAKAMDRLASLICFEINKAQADSLYSQICHVPIGTLHRACKWYVYDQDDKFPSKLIGLIAKRCKELHYPPSTTVIDGVEMGLVNMIDGREKYLPVDELVKRRIAADKRKRITLDESIKTPICKDIKGYLPHIKGTEIPPEQKANQEEQIARLKEQYT